MSPRRLISFSGRLVQGFLYAGLAGAVLFFALTRTEVGRDGLRLELERQFSRSFNGNLQIGGLTGNLVNRFSASNVQLRDSTGRIVLAIDSVIIYPRLHDLLNRRFSTGKITLVRPELNLVRLENGSWLAETLLGEQRESGSPETWSFQATEVRIIDGRVTTRSVGAPPRAVRDSLVFNYADADIFDLDGRAIVDWQPDLKQFDLLDLSGRIPALALTLSSSRGQVYIEEDRVSLNAFQLKLGDTKLNLAARLSSFGDLKNDPASAIVELDLRESALHGEQLRRIFPKLVLGDVVTAAARLQGPLSELIVEDLSVRRGSSSLSLEGSLLGLPDSLDYELALRPAVVTWHDVQAVLPGIDVPRFDHLGSVALSGFSDGIVRFRPGPALPSWQAQSQVQLSTRAGRVEGDVLVAVGEGSGVTINSSLHAADLDIGRVARNTAYASRLNGTISISTFGRDLSDLDGGVSLSLGESSFAGRSLDSLRLDLAGNSGDFTGRLSFSQGGGRMEARLEARVDEIEARYRLEGAISNFDLGRITLSDSISSSLNTRFVLAGTGSTWDMFAGTVGLAFDSSSMRVAGRSLAIEPHTTELTVRAPGRQPRLELTGDLAHIQVDSDLSLKPLLALARYWGGEVAEAGRSQLEKRYRSSDSLGSVIHETAPDQDDTDVSIAHLPAQRLRANVKVLRSDILSALLPMLPELRTDAVGTIDLVMDGDHFALETSFSADSVLSGSHEARGVEMVIRAGGSTQDLLSRTLVLDVSVDASELRSGNLAFSSPQVRARLKSETAELDFRASAPGALQTQRLHARLDLLPDRNRVTLDSLKLIIRDQAWENFGASVIDVYGDAVVVDDIRLRRPDADSTNQQVLIDGTLSRSTADTLFVELDNLSVARLSQMAGVNRTLGGAINGRIAYTGLDRTPEITGTIEVSPLSLDSRILGHLSIASRYIPGSPDVGLMADLRPLTQKEAASLPPSYTIEESRLGVEGTFRLPGGRADAADPGALDLRVDIARADAFFFEYIFKEVIDEVEGYFTGSGTITGNFKKPIFNASAELSDAGFIVPEFRLRYNANGHVSVDATGIHLDGLNLSDPTAGRARIRGSVLFNDYRYFSFDLSGDLEKLRIMNVSQSRELPFYGRIWASGFVTLTGPIDNTTLRSTNVVTSRESELYIPISGSEEATDAGFIVFADSTGKLPDIRRLTRRANLLASRPAGEREFLDGMEMDLNIQAPEGSTVHLVIDPLLGDVINAVGSGRVQLLRTEGEFFTYGSFDVSSGDYLFTAGEVFFRRFLIDDGTITWDGDPLDAVLNIQASYRTRASRAGLGVAESSDRLIPLIIRLNVSGRVATPSVDLALNLDRDERSILGVNEGLEVALNQPDRSAQYATSVLLTNSFLLTTDASSIRSEDTRNQLAFNSLSQLVASQLNRYLNYALPNVDLNLGVQGESAENLDVTYGVALRLLDQRLIIRGQGIYESSQTTRTQQGMLDEFVVEVRLSPTVSVEMFYRREEDLISTESMNTNAGAGLSYQTQFSSWRRFMERLFGWLTPNEKESTGGILTAEKSNE